jgi:hypothetical protein
MSELINTIISALKVAAGGPWYWSALAVVIVLLSAFRVWLINQNRIINQQESDQQAAVDQGQIQSDGKAAEDALVADGDNIDAIRAKARHSLTQRRLNWKRSPVDERDFQYSAIEVVPTKLPALVDLRAYCSPIEDQGNLGSCTAQALVGLIEYLQLQAWRKNLTGLESLIYEAHKFVNASRLFVYWNERVLEGTSDSDSGATTMRDGCRSEERRVGKECKA